MKKIVIGLLGESKTGKDWIGKKLISNLNLKFNPDTGLIKAADILKIEAEKRYPGIFCTKTWESSGDNYREVIVPKIKISRRQILQDMGNELSGKNPNYVYDYLKKEISLSTSELILITDLRNTLESLAIVHSKGIVIKVNRHLKFRYPEVWDLYVSELILKNVTSTQEFMGYIENRHEGLYKKLIHSTEESVESVPSKFISFNLENEPNKERKLKSLILKLRAL